MSEEEQNKIEDLKKVLYSPNAKLPDTMILDLHQHPSGIKKEWEQEPVDTTPEPENPKKFSLIILMISAVFFVCSVFFALYIYFKGDNVISTQNIAVDISGPVTVNAGEPLLLDITVTNNNETPLILADLVLEYPKGTKNPVDKVSDLVRERISVGTVAPHQTVRKETSALVFDEEGSTVKIKYFLEYRLENSGGVFNAEGTYDVAIGSSPVALKVDMLKEVNSDQDLVLDVLVTSNSSEIVKDLLLKGEFPTGFEIKSTTPSPLPNKSVWDLGDIEPKGERKIKVIGTLNGSQNEEKTFKFVIGGKSVENESVIEKPFLNLAKSIILKKPFLSIGLLVDKGNDVIKSGKTIENLVTFQNNLSVPITDVVIEARLKGDMVVKESVEAEKGFYRASTDTLSWTKIESPALASIAAGKTSNVYFNYILLGAFAKEAANLKNQEVLVDITVRGKRLSEDNVPETIESTITRKVKIATEARFNTIVNHYEGPFKNVGVYPPKVEATTEFAITWAVTNSLNNIEGAKIEATLPSYVEWLGNTTPTSEKIIYDKDSRTITWEIGKILAGGGISGSLRKVSFQVGLTPSLSQVGESPSVVNLATFTGRDTFTGKDVTLSNNPVTIAVPTESKFEFDNDHVVK
jgi:hypothetical protein